MRTEAQAEAETVLSEAREKSAARVEQANAAVGGLISQADELRSRVGLLGEELAGSAPSREETVSEVPGGPVIVPEPTPPTIPEPTPDPVPEPTPDPVPEPTPDPTRADSGPGATRARTRSRAAHARARPDPAGSGGERSQHR